MRVLPLSSAPNQAFTATIDNVRWGIRLVTVPGCMAATVTRNGVTLLDNVRALAGEPLIPYPYLITGNFIFVTIGDDLPAAGLFGSDQVLVYLSPEEIAGLPAWTVGDAVALEETVEYIFTDQGLYITTDNGELIQSA